MDDLFRCSICIDTLTTMLKRCAGEMVEPLMLIKEGLWRSEVLGVDETNLRVSQRQDWIHAASSNYLTLLK